MLRVLAPRGLRGERTAIFRAGAGSAGGQDTHSAVTFVGCCATLASNIELKCRLLRSQEANAYNIACTGRAASGRRIQFVDFEFVVNLTILAQQLGDFALVSNEVNILFSLT